MAQYRVFITVDLCSAYRQVPLSEEAFESLKTSIEKAVVTDIDKCMPFEVETDSLGWH